MRILSREITLDGPIVWIASNETKTRVARRERKVNVWMGTCVKNYQRAWSGWLQTATSAVDSHVVKVLCLQTIGFLPYQPAYITSYVVLAKTHKSPSRDVHSVVYWHFFGFIAEIENKTNSSNQQQLNSCRHSFWLQRINEWKSGGVFVNFD